MHVCFILYLIRYIYFIRVHIFSSTTSSFPKREDKAEENESLEEYSIEK